MHHSQSNERFPRPGWRSFHVPVLILGRLERIRATAAGVIHALEAEAEPAC
jgi:hypothetical protein